MRIYPGIFVAILFSVFVVGLYFTVLDTSAYVHDEVVQKFVKRNALLYSSLKYSLPGVFEMNPLPNAVVGSIWTLPYQLKAYVSVAVIALLFQSVLGDVEKGISRLIYTILVLALIVFNIINQVLDLVNIPYLRLFAFFYTGSIIYIWRDKILLSHKIILSLILLMACCVFIDPNVFYVVYALSLGYVVLYLAYLPKGKIRAFNNWGDYSYGIYIYGFTVQQSIVALVGEISVIQLFCYASVCTFMLAVLSWHFVEKPLLKLR